MRKIDDDAIDHLEWARHPRSPIAVQAVIDTAAKDWRFKGILQALREQGVIDDGNVCRKVWESGGKQFVAFGGQA